jgi:hypothetical protein
MVDTSKKKSVPEQGSPYINQGMRVIIYYDSFGGSAKVRLQHMKLWFLDVLSLG